MNITRSILLILSLLAGTCASAQGFFKTYSPTSSSAQDVVQTDDGGYCMVGQVEDDSLLFLQRVSATGQLLWANNFYFNQAKAIALTKANDGGFAVLTEFYADTNGYKNVVLKLNATGAIVWSKVIDNNFLPNGLRDIVTTADGGFLLAGDTRDANLNFQNWLVKLASDGSIAWSKTYGNTFLNTSRIIALPGGDFAISGGRNNGDLSLARVSPSGDLIWQQGYAKPSFQKAYDLIVTVDGNIAVLGTSQHPTLGRLEVCILKANLNGSELWFNSVYPFTWPDPSIPLLIVHGFAQDTSGNFYVPLGNWNVSVGTLDLLKLSNTGNALWKREISTNAIPYAIIRTNDHYFAIVGEASPVALLLKLDGEGEFNSNKIRGTVFQDDVADCILGSGEPGAANFIVEAHGQNGELYFKKTNNDGTYEIRVSEGDYDLLAKPVFGPQEFYAVCDTPTVSIVGVNQTIDNQNIGIETLAECPMLEVEIGGGLLRRCTQTHYTVIVCNYGNLVAENASVQVTADSVLQYVSSSTPLTSQSGNVYTFNIPDVPAGDCSSFNIDFLVKCAADLGDVICIEAHGFPDTSCIAPGSAWDGSQIEVSGKCEGGNITFNIKNKGAAAMSQGLDYVIIEDHIMYMQGNIQLGAGNDTTIVIANPDGACYLGKVVTMDNGVSIVTKPTAVVQNCISGGNLNLALQFETGPNNAAIATTCAEVIGSFDPNDKQGFPLGWQDQHLLERNQDIEYMIRFQNTGNDTAFLVVVRDTLPVATLDPGTLRPISASHDYTWDVTGNGIATFTFANILLPDSTRNEPASHGYVRFRIRQQPDLADGTRIENDAAIFFDFNEPVITNQYFHTVGSPLVLVTHNPGAAQQVDFQVIPNPFSSEATFVLKDYTPKDDLTFRLFDAQGMLAREERFQGSTFLFTAQKLPAGIYFFRIEEAGRLLSTGKVAISK